MVLANFFIAQGLVIKGHFIDRTNKLSLETHFSPQNQSVTGYHRTCRSQLPFWN